VARRGRAGVPRAPHELEVGSVFVDATIGVAVSGASAEDNARLPIDADLALTKAKATGKGTVSLFNASMRQELARQVELERDLEQALKSGQIVAHYQPLVDLATGRVVGVEALARWRHPSRGWISPAEFIPVAEASGQIVALGRVVLKAACRDGLLLPEHIPMSVNISVAQRMQVDVVDEIISLLESTGFPAERLKLEVTESVVMEDAARGLAVLQRLKGAGISIALDDFGTGYSSLSFLRRFPFDKLKMDKSFVQDLHQSDAVAIMSTVANLGKRLSMDTTAEGIESDEQFRRVLKEGFTQVQGFLYGKPIPAGEIQKTWFGRPNIISPLNGLAAPFETLQELTL
jgi:predicted signal transduction protein with EAL and GGDEF domain